MSATSGYDLAYKYIVDSLIEAAEKESGWLFNQSDGFWEFPSSGACSRFLRVAEAKGCQMWGSLNIGGVIALDRWEENHLSCVDGLPVTPKDKGKL